jgi:hypothetical protein
LSLQSDDLDSIGELYTEDDFRQLVVSVEATPACLGGLSELEDHGERGLVGETPLGAHRAVGAHFVIPSRLRPPTFGPDFIHWRRRGRSAMGSRRLERARDRAHRGRIPQKEQPPARPGDRPPRARFLARSISVYCRPPVGLPDRPLRNRVWTGGLRYPTS